MAYTVKAVAEFAGVSVRTLHHYDTIGLLKPASLSPNGYRLYTDADLERLQQILFFRELGFNLAEIKNILDSPGYDRKEAMLSHRRLMEEKKRRLEEILRSLDRTINAIERGITMEKREMFEAFDETRINEYLRQIREKYGQKTAGDSRRGTTGHDEAKWRNYTREEWDMLKDEGRAIWNDMAALMDREPGDTEVQAVVGRWCRHINDRFHPVSKEMLNGIADLWLGDSRFSGFHDRIKPGLADFTRDALKVYCERME